MLLWIEAAGWDMPGSDNWITSDDALFVIEAGVAGGMGAPEIVPFATQVAAQAFQEIYGGRVVAISDIPDETVLGAIDHDAELKVPQ